MEAVQIESCAVTCVAWRWLGSDLGHANPHTGIFDGFEGFLADEQEREVAEEARQERERALKARGRSSRRK